MTRIIFIFILFFVTIFGLSDYRKCADPECKVPISNADVVMNYNPSEPEKVSMNIGDKVTVYSKDAGNDKSLWGVEIDGKRGYVPKYMIKETRIFKKKLEYIVPTTGENLTKKISLDSELHKDHATGVPHTSNSYSVVDGTTIYENTTGTALETQPTETITIDVPKSINIESSKTIDATSISENKLDDPNSSIILPQPTTSNVPMYSAGADENFRETQTKIYTEDFEKSTVEVIETGNNIGVSSDSKETVIESKYSENPEKHGETENDSKDNMEKEEKNLHGKPDDGEEPEEDEEEEEEEEEEEVEDENEDSEEKDETKLENEKESENVYKKNEDSSTESSGIKSEETTFSEQEVIQNTEKNMASVDSEQGDGGIINEPDTSYSEEHAKDTGLLYEHGKPPSRPDRLDEVNILDSGVESQQYSLNDLLNDTDISDVSHVNQDETSHRSDVLWPPLKASEEKEELKQTGENSSENLDNLEGKERTSNPYDILGKLNGNGRIEDADVGKNQNDDFGTSSESNEFQSKDIPAPEENAMIEQTTTGNEFQVNGDLYSSATEENSYETLQDEGLRQNESEVSTSEDSDIQENDSLMPENTLETSSEVQGTCDADVVGCKPETEDLPKQQTSEEADPRCFFPQLESTNEARGILIPITPRAMNKDNIETFQTTLFLIVTAITVLVFTLGYYYLEKQRTYGFLRAKINNLENELMLTSQEKYTLIDELENAKEKVSDFITSSDSLMLKEDLEESQAARLDLEEQVAGLEKELEAATEAGLELNRMMSELLSVQQGSDTLMKSVEHLQKQLDSQQATINTMTANLKAKNLENESLQLELKCTSEHAKNLEDQLFKVNETLTKLQEEKIQIEYDFHVKNQSIEQQLMEALESKSANSQRLSLELDALQDVLDETRKTLAAREGEVSVLREYLNHAEIVSSGGVSTTSLEELLDVGHLRAKIDDVGKERDELLEKLRGEEDARKLLEDHMKIVSEEVSTLRAKYEEADREKTEAQTRLDVLSSYFKEKETQLQKELGLQEAMCIQKEGVALSTIEDIKIFQEEIENYKAQIEMLKKEILDQERSMKSQNHKIVMLEQKNHENWVAARQAERRLEESKQEASQLRNKLTMTGRRIVGTIPGPDVGKPERGALELEHNGKISASPAHMGETQEMPSSPLHFGLPGSPPLLPPGGQPLPPGPFPGLPMFLPPGAPGIPFSLPPPPGGLFPDDLRPPPLGRMSSPPPEPLGSFSPFEHSPPVSPPNRPYRSPPHYENSPSRYRHQTPPSSGTPSFSGPFSPGKWEERSDPPRSSFRPLHRDSPREPKGSTLSSGHSSESLDKGSRQSRV